MLLSSPRNTTTKNNQVGLLLVLGSCCWGTVTVTTYLIRWWKRNSITLREEIIQKNGGLMPQEQVQNPVMALAWRAQHTPNQLALEDSNSRDHVIQYTWKEYYNQVQQFATALLVQVQQGEQQQQGQQQQGQQQEQEQLGVAIHSFNESRWFFAAMGAMAAEFTVSGIYLTNTYEQIVHVLQTSNVKVLLIESRELFNTTYNTGETNNVLNDFPNLTIVLLQDDDNDDDNDKKGAANGGGGTTTNQRVMSYSEFLAKGRKQTSTATSSSSSSVLLKPPHALDPNTVTTLVYTSGTTGNPKAVELTHNNIHSVCAMMHARIPLDETTKVVSYLPLSHIAAMGIDMFSSLYCGASVHFADRNALKGSLKDTLLRVRPTLFFGVPRVWEKMALAMQSTAAKSYAKPISGTILKSIGTAAKWVGKTWWDNDTPEWLKCSLLVIPFGFFKLLAFRKVRKGCGLDRCRLLFTGAAPLSADTMWYLRSLDMPLLEVFGMSESTGAIAVCGPNDFNRPMGACGKALPLGQLSIAPEDGEILWKGANSMIGYKGLPAATKAALNPDTNNLHTGDIGRIDNDGYLFITGRKKDIIITAGGENVAPTPIEESFMSLLNGTAGHVVLIGDQRKFLTILIAPTEAGVVPTPEQIEFAMKEYNTNLAKSRAQQVQKAYVLDSPLDVQTGELTPTMKVKRSYLVKKFMNEINSMYEDGSTSLVGYSSVNIGNLDAAV